MGVDVFVALILCLSSCLLILERGANIPVTKKELKKSQLTSQEIVLFNLYCAELHSTTYHVCFCR